jgi:hypothetical protein
LVASLAKRADDRADVDVLLSSTLLARDLVRGTVDDLRRPRFRFKHVLTGDVATAA